MRMRRANRGFWTGMLSLVAVSIFSAFAAANTVALSGAEDASFGISANDLKPSECSALNLTNIVTGSGNIQGSNGSDLILGGASADKINAKKGNDCVLGGDGDDELKGGDQDDVLLGGPGNDDLQGEKGQDTCYGGSGTDTSDGSCEVIFEIP
jgi:Ca2+-binding RTX toxin-like protein